MRDETASLVITTPFLRAVLSCAALLSLSCAAGAPAVAPDAPAATRALNYLKDELDVYHHQTVVYDDFESGGERFFASGWMKGPNPEWPVDQRTLRLSPAAGGAREGATCLRVQWAPPPQDQWVAVAWQRPENNWGSATGVNLTSATRLRFWARGETGDELVEFKFAPLQDRTRPYRDSCPTLSTGVVRLRKEWRWYEIKLDPRRDLRSIISGFCFAISKDDNPRGCVFYLDHISIRHERLEEPRLIRSYHMGRRSIDEARQLRNTCFVYDNALAICAFLSDPTPEHNRRAKLIADALVRLSASQPDGHLRNGYCCGELFDDSGRGRIPGRGNLGEDGNVPARAVPWLADTYAASADCGNMAWAMLALLNVWERDGSHDDSAYLYTARRLGQWIIDHAQVANETVGFYGGFTWEWSEGQFKREAWKSTEHNIDLAVAFARLAASEDHATRRDQWHEASQRAKRFVSWAQAQGRNDGGRLITGTLDGKALVPNMHPKPLDPQTWSVIAFLEERRRYEPSLNWALRECRIEEGDLRGFQFSAGVGQSTWPEGGGQVALALKALGRQSEGDEVLRELEFVMTRAASAGAPDGALPAAWPNPVDTGFGWKYYEVPHCGATAWFVLAKNGWNPYTGRRLP